MKNAAAASTPFVRRVYLIVRSIPSGRIATYGDVARMAGRPGAARAVGNAMRSCDDPSIPCHRVTAAGGLLGGFGSWPQIKRQRLEDEGVKVRGKRLVEFRSRRWIGERTARTTPAKAARATRAGKGVKAGKPAKATGRTLSKRPAAPTRLTGRRFGPDRRRNT